jgi:hypothetical protein
MKRGVKNKAMDPFMRELFSTLHDSSTTETTERLRSTLKGLSHQWTKPYKSKQMYRQEGSHELASKSMFGLILFVILQGNRLSAKH